MISDFQMALAGIAIAVVIAVIVYNRWQESKYRRRAERAFSADHPDVLFGAQQGDHASRVEPQLGDMSSPRQHDDVEEGLLSPIVSAPIFPRSTDDISAPSINAEIDTIALVLADTPMLPDQFWPTIHQSRQVSTNILWEGLVGGLWQPITENSDDDTGFRELRAGLQLASRSGAVEGSTLQAFNEMMAAFAQGIGAPGVGAVVQREDVNIAMRRAQSVDALCADTDIEIVVNIIGKSGTTFATTKVRGLAESNGLVPLGSGEYVLRDELGHVLFTMRNMNAEEPPGIKSAGTYLTGLSFALDVPRTPMPQKVFERMMTLALRFADTLHGEVVDDNRKLLTANGRKVIVDTIVQITGVMQAKGVIAGSSAALRLYS